MTSKPSNPARNIRRSLMKFKKTGPALTEAEIAELRPHILQRGSEHQQAHAEAVDVFELYQNFHEHEFLEYLEKHLPAPLVILQLIRIAVASDDPYKMNLLGRKKAKVVYGAPKKALLVAYEQYRHSTNNKGKAHFARLQAKTLKTSAGKLIKVSTIYRWLLEIKNSS